MEEKQWILLGRYLSNECSREEKKIVETWAASNPENKRLLKKMANVWQAKEIPVQDSDLERLWNEVSEKAGISVVPENPAQIAVQKINRLSYFQPKIFQILRYAAILFILLLPFLIHNEFSIPSWIQFSSELIAVNVKNGDRQQIRLSDGSTVVLDAGSLLKYPAKFDSDTREVFLDGEAFFEVASNPEKPFIVDAGDAVVQVLGTKFNVRAWHKYRRVQVAVSEGKVSFSSEKGADKDAVILASGFSSIVLVNGLPSQPQMVDMEKQLSWMNNEVIFDDTPLHIILFQLERWYDLQFVLADSSVAAERLTVHIQKQSIEDILELIAALTDLQYQHKGKVVYFGLKEFNQR